MLTDDEIEAGRHETFSTSNPFCPCDSKTFRKAVRWAESEIIRRLAAEKAKAEPVWISVEDRLPEKFTEVLIAFEESTLPATGQYTGHASDPDGWSYPWENHGDRFECWTVTHWMELPATPKELADAAPTHPEHQRSEG